MFFGWRILTDTQVPLRLGRDPHCWTRTLDSVIRYTLGPFEISTCSSVQGVTLATYGRLISLWTKLWLLFHCDSSALGFLFTSEQVLLGLFWSYDQIYVVSQWIVFWPCHIHFYGLLVYSIRRKVCKEGMDIDLISPSFSQCWKKSSEGVNRLMFFE